MKKLYFLLLLLLIIPTLHAQKYGYIDKDELYRSIPEYDTASIQLENLRKEYETQLASMQGELSSKATALNNEAAGMSEFVRKSKQDELKNLNVRLQLFSVKANSQLEDQKQKLLLPIVEKADDAIKTVAKEQGYVFVLDASQLYYMDEKKCINMLPLVKAKLGLK
jgi:outer membrane protein